MPTHNYKCPECGFKFEAQTKMGDPNPTCPNLVWKNRPFPIQRAQHEVACGATVDKTFDWGAAPAVQFNGGGWHNDEYPK